MSLANPWSSQNMCVLATAGPEGPLATPVRYWDAFRWENEGAPSPSTRIGEDMAD